ncbi:MAG: hypothetical protein HY367_01310 [Candidatus Aenigmarchaeota archaeon]|nr:hypothetical protein [Candidatus Aenigmarchaeota archaeon]
MAKIGDYVRNGAAALAIAGFAAGCGDARPSATGTFEYNGMKGTVAKSVSGAEIVLQGRGFNVKYTDLAFDGELDGYCIDLAREIYPGYCTDRTNEDQFFMQVLWKDGAETYSKEIYSLARESLEGLVRAGQAPGQQQ